MNIPEIFGSMVFNDSAMKSYLSEKTYKELKATVEKGAPLSIEIAKEVATGMKNWATDKGATHYTHWFQPLNGVTAEKHDSFISPTEDGKIIMDFSEKALIKGESDASSFPSGGLRATFEARGYTAWDPTSYAFIKEKTLYIPSVFCSLSGATLDKKTPLMRSNALVGKQALRIVKMFGDNTTKRVETTVGAEQEYFLVDKKLFEKRVDLMYCGRTLFGVKPPKAQELADHYYGNIKPRVKEFMNELNIELWKLGILAKTEHNEVAPAQHELAPIFTLTNTACDHNQLTMECMKKVADKLDLVCLLHEKPFEFINGSGKHNNWSLSTDNGVNLFEPGNSPSENAQFLLFICAVMKAVDKHQDLLRISVASAGNDHRLGGHEAPPAIISLFLGDELYGILKAIDKDIEYNGPALKELNVGVDALPHITLDNTDRNRTSPFAFTGNKFEFRMVGSSQSIAEPNIILNTIVAETLDEFAEKLENAKDFNEEVNTIIKETIKNHKRILFNGNGYDDAWISKAEKRGLLNLKTTADCVPLFNSEKNVALFEKYGIFTKAELDARTEILLENYCKVINIEAATTISMARRYIFGACTNYQIVLNAAKLTLKSAKKLSEKISEHLDKMMAAADELSVALSIAENNGYDAKSALYYKEKVLPLMEKVRFNADELDKIVDKKYWPFPTYGDLLLRV